MKVKIWNLLKRIIPIIPIWQAFQVLFTQLGEVFKLKSSFWDINTFAILYTAQFFMFQTVYKKLVNNYVDKILPNFDLPYPPWLYNCGQFTFTQAWTLEPLPTSSWPRNCWMTPKLAWNSLYQTGITSEHINVVMSQTELFREKPYIFWIDIQKVETIVWLISFS